MIFTKPHTFRQVLAYAGTLPFVIAATCALTHQKQLPVVGEVESAISLYGLVIATFMAGVHWGQQLSRTDCWAYWLTISSNLQAIALWLCFLLLSNSTALVILPLSFSVLLATDWQLKRAKIITADYFHLRLSVSATVLISLILFIVFS